MPMAWAAIPIRPPSSVPMAILNPSPSWPRRFAAGTSMFSKKMVQEGLAQIPSFSSAFWRMKPGVPVSTTKAVMPLVPFDRSVMVKSTIASATGPLVIQFLVPLMTYVSPLRVAVVRCSAASEPACGSVRPKQPSFSPAANGFSQRSFCSSVPNLRTGSQ